jgi:ribosomal protein S18 acetylase RimI-like enzyme
VASDLESITPLAGSPDRARARVRAAELGDDSMLVAAVSGGIVGAASIRWFGGCVPPHPWLYGLHVGAEVRRTGIGQALTSAAEEIALQRGAKQMTLDVEVDETGAIAFYEALGYAVVQYDHQHHWRSIDWRTGTVIAEGISPTLIMRRLLQ